MALVYSFARIGRHIDLWLDPPSIIDHVPHFQIHIKKMLLTQAAPATSVRMVVV